MITKFCNKRISAIYSVLPTNEVDFMEEMGNYAFTEAQMKKLKKVMGFNTRRVIKEGETVSDYAIYGIKQMLADKVFTEDEVGGIIVTTTSPDYFIPPTSNVIQGAFDFDHDTVCLDISQGCCGYTVGLTTSFMVLNSLPKGKKVLLVAGDILSNRVSKRDRASRPIVGDGTAITLIETVEEENEIYAGLTNDGKAAFSVYIPAGGSKMPITPETTKEEEDEFGNWRGKQHLVMQGDLVFNFIINDTPILMEKVLAYANENIHNIDYFVCHQSSVFTLKKLAEHLEVSRDKVPMDIVPTYGNSSSATIPVTFCQHFEEMYAEKDTLKIMFAAFGTGLSIGCVMMDVPKLKHCKLLNYPHKNANIQRFINSRFTSNTYVLWLDAAEGVWVIDPGDVAPVTAWMKQNGKRTVKGVLLTHTHFDHIYGLNDLLVAFPAVPVFVYDEGGKAALYNDKINGSRYAEMPFVLCDTAHVCFLPEDMALWEGVVCRVLHTPGHSPDSVCFAVEGALFTGDTLIKDIRTVTKLKGGSPEDLKESIGRLEQLKGRSITVYPGHDEFFSLDSYDLSIAYRNPMENMSTEDFSRYNGEGTLLKRVQQRSLEMMIEIDKICRKHSIEYWLTFGSLIGAARHKGFIPWDDDIDISIRQEDIPRFRKAMVAELPPQFVYQDWTTDKHYFLDSVIKIRDTKSYFPIEVYKGFKEQGLLVDVIAMERMPFKNLRNRVLKINKYPYLRKKEISIYGKTQYPIKGLLLTPIAELFKKYAHWRSRRSKSRVWKFNYTFVPRESYTPMAQLQFDESEIFPLQECDFEGHKFFIPNNVDAFLSRLFGGDWNEIPCEEKRTPHTLNITFLD